MAMESGAGQDMAWHGKAWHGRQDHGKAVAWHGMIWRTRHGMEDQGMEWCGKMLGIDGKLFCMVVSCLEGMMWQSGLGLEWLPVWNGVTKLVLFEWRGKLV